MRASSLLALVVWTTSTFGAVATDQPAPLIAPSALQLGGPTCARVKDATSQPAGVVVFDAYAIPLLDRKAPSCQR